MVEINKWRGTNFQCADEQHKEKSRYVVKDFANTRDPTMFAAASDTAVGRVVEFKAVTQKLQHVSRSM